MHLRKARVPVETREAVGAHVGMNRRTLARWERENLTRFDHNLLLKLAAYYGVLPEHLLEDMPTPPPTDATATGS